MTSNADDVVLVGGRRTPFSKLGGALKDWSSVDMAAFLLPRTLEALGVPADRLDLLVTASALSAETAGLGPVIGRQALVSAGLPDSVLSFSVDQASASGGRAVTTGWQAIATGEVDVCAVLGVEAMSNTGFLLPPSMRWKGQRGNSTITDPLFPLRLSVRPKGVVAEVDGEADQFGVDRDAMDIWAHETQLRYEAARSRGFLEGELIPVVGADGTPVLAADEPPRPQTSLDKLRSLSTVFGSRTITPGNTPGLETGAALLVLARRSVADSLGLPVLATVPATASVAGAIDAPLSQTARAVHRLLDRSGRSVAGVDAFEFEEDFAAVVPICENYLARELGADPAELRKRINPNGGAVALGHPPGAAGVRIVLSLGRHLQQIGGGRGVAAVAGALSQGSAVLLEADQSA